jgi:hypothetical protein
MGPKKKAAIKATSVPPTNLLVDDTGVHATPVTSTAPATGAAATTNGATAAETVAKPAATGS